MMAFGARGKLSLADWAEILADPPVLPDREQDPIGYAAYVTARLQGKLDRGSWQQSLVEMQEARIENAKRTILRQLNADLFKDR